MILQFFTIFYWTYAVAYLGFGKGGAMASAQSASL